MTLLEKVEGALSRVIDPGTHLDVMRMRLIKDISAGDEGRVRLTFEPSSPVCPMAFQLAHEIQKAVQRTEGVRAVEIRVSGYIKAEELMDTLKQAQNG